MLTTIRDRAVEQGNSDALKLIGEIERLRSTYMRDYAAKLLNVRPDVLDFFEMVDPFNPDNTVLGFLSHQADHRYGALVILQVNGQDCPQVIYGTPKLHYPFAKDQEDGTRRYHWGLYQRGAAYEKLDGSAVCQYSYANHIGKRFSTAKLRLSPFLRNGKFGPFLDMWRECVATQSILVPEEVERGELSLTYELHGSRNLITVHYPFPLKATLLFGVKQADAGPIIPEECPESVQRLANQRVFDVDCKADLTREYERLRADAETKCIVTGEDESREISGIEGYVLYLLTADKPVRWVLLKIKPAEIEEIHWHNSTLSYKSILPTVWNALETTDVDALSYDVVKQLLLEESQEEKIEEAKDLVLKAIKAVQATVHFRLNVRLVFTTAPASTKTNKRDLMRYMAQHFEREQAKHVYTALVQQGLIPDDLPATSSV